MSNKWIEFVKDYAKKKGMKYSDALKDKGLKIAYDKSKKGGKKEEGTKKGDKRKGAKMAGSRLAFDDTKQEKDKKGKK